MAKGRRQFRLKKELGFWQITLYGVGIIIGAGIYALIGLGAGVAGNTIWVSFIVAAFLAFFTGLSYAELSSMYPKDAAEYVYTQNAFHRRQISFIVQWIMVFTVIVSAATVALGFAGYFTYLFGGSLPIIAAGLILMISLVNYMGMKESSRINIISTIVETSGLVLVAILGLLFIGQKNIDIFALPPTGIAGIMSGTAIIFFAYLGFEEMVNLSEETKNAKKVVPKALIVALAISTLLYVLVSISAVGIVGSERLATSKAPLTEVVSSIIPNSSLIFSFIALFATGNTVLVMLVVASRMLYGLSRNKSVPIAFGRVGKRNTPYVSIAAVTAFSIFVLLISGIKTVALLTDVGIFLVYICVNASLIWLRYKQPRVKRGFKSPVNIGKFPVLAFLGLVSSLLMLFYFDHILLVYEVFVVFIGLLLYKFFKDHQKIKRRH